MSDFDLRSTIRDVLDEGGCDSFREYANKVLGCIPPKEFKNVLMETLPELIRHIDHRPTPVLVPTKGAYSSRKVAAIAQAWQLFLARHIATSEGLQVRLADASEEQVRFYAGLLRVKASEVAARADAFERIADSMQENGAGRVRDLPMHLGQALIKDAA